MSFSFVFHSPSSIRDIDSQREQTAQSREKTTNTTTNTEQRVDERVAFVLVSDAACVFSSCFCLSQWTFTHCMTKKHSRNVGTTAPWMWKWTASLVLACCSSPKITKYFILVNFGDDFICFIYLFRCLWTDFALSFVILASGLEATCWCLESLTEQTRCLRRLHIYGLLDLPRRHWEWCHGVSDGISVTSQESNTVSPHWCC